MSILYVPVVVPPQVPSRQTRELAELLSRVIAEYEHTHSAVTPAEIQQALAMAQPRSGSSVDVRRVAAVVGGLAVALGAGVAALIASSGGLDLGAVLPWLEAGVVAVLLVAVVVLVLRRRP